MSNSGKELAFSGATIATSTSPCVGKILDTLKLERVVSLGIQIVADEAIRVTASFYPTEEQIEALANALEEEGVQLIDKEYLLATQGTDAK